MLFAINKLVVFENGVMGIMFELKTEELGRKGCILWTFKMYCACEVLQYQRTGTRWVRNVACIGAESELEQIFGLKMGSEESIQKACMNM